MSMLMRHEKNSWSVEGYDDGTIWVRSHYTSRQNNTTVLEQGFPSHLLFEIFPQYVAKMVWEMSLFLKEEVK